MENSAINLAHQCGRKADNHLKYGRFTESIASHGKAADLLLEALAQKPSSPKAVESIKLQHEYHRKQMDLIRLKQQQYEKYKATITILSEQTALKTVTGQSKIGTIHDKNNLSGNPSKTTPTARDICELQTAIYQTVNESDDLLSNFCETVVENVQEKDYEQKATVDRLHLLNQKLNSLVHQLVHQMDVQIAHVNTLTDRIEQLELDKVKSAWRQSIEQGLNDSRLNNLTIIESDQETVINSEELSRGDDRLPIETVLDMIELPPLELPTFDYDTFDNHPTDTK